MVKMASRAIELAGKIAPKSGELPSLEGIDIDGCVIPMLEVGGDRITWVSFKDRYPLDHWAENVLEGGKDHLVMPALENVPEGMRDGILQAYRENLSQKILSHKGKAGVAMTDVAGHEDESLIVNASFHQSLMTGVLDHLPIRGEVPLALFENLNTRYHTTGDFETHLALLYAEISEQGKCRYVAANSHAPMLYSRQYGKMFHLQDTHESSLPIGFAISSFSGADEMSEEGNLVKPPYEVNEIEIAKGDILLLYSDGLHDHILGDGSKYISSQLEQTVNEVKDAPIRKVCEAIKADVKIDEREDDISFVAIRRN